MKHFLIIDDDSLNNRLSSMAIKIAMADAKVDVFSEPVAALEFIRSKVGILPAPPNTIVLLDINMPVMTGWELLEKFAELPDQIKNCYSIYILSSSINPLDIEKAQSNPHVIDFIEKPLKKAKLLQLFS